MKIRRVLLVLMTGAMIAAGFTGAAPGDAGTPAEAPQAAGSEAAARAAAVQLPPTSNRPPRELKFTAGHWTAWDPPQVPDGAKPYVIVPGDTLWDLSGKFIADPMLWPLVWDANRYIQDSHWIYPGDPLFVPAAPTVVPPGPLAAAPEESVPEAPRSAATETPGPVVQPVALADWQDLYCSEYIDEDYHRPAMRISAVEEEDRLSNAEGDVVYLNLGTGDGVTAGDEFDVIRPRRDIGWPLSGRLIGTLVERLGRLKVLAAHPDSSTAIITRACTAIDKGDRVVASWDPEVPVGFAAEQRYYERYGSDPSGKTHGIVIAMPLDIIAAGEGHIVQVTVGEEAGVKPGDRLTFFRPHEAGRQYERKTIGVGMVVTTRPGSSAVKVVETNREVYVGDEVEIR